MNLYLISQNIHSGYDTYSDAVVAAESEKDAKTIHPDGRSILLSKTEFAIKQRDSWGGYKLTQWGDTSSTADWADKPSQVKAKLIGRAAPGIERGVICASFHAG